MEIFNGNNIHRELNAGANIFYFKVRVMIPDDVSERDPFAHKLQDVVHWNTRTCNARFSEMDTRVDGDSILHGFSCWPQYLTPNIAAGRALHGLRYCSLIRM